MFTVSYAENWEDILLARLFAPGYQGFYIDIGAADVTRYFHDRGWSGINLLQPPRTRDVNLVESTSLAELCETHVRGEIDLLVVGLPGEARDVLDGGDWERWRPRVVLVRVERHGSPDGHEAWEKVLLNAQYTFAAFNGLTRFYVRDEERHLAAALATPVNAFDDFVPAALEDELGRLRRELAAARAVNEALRSMYAGVAEVDALRAQTANLEAATAAIQAQCDEARAVMADALSRYEQLRRDITQARIEVVAAQSAFPSVGPAGMAVARKLAQASRRFPAAASVAKRSARLAGRVRRVFR